MEILLSVCIYTSLLAPNDFLSKVSNIEIYFSQDNGHPCATVLIT